MQHHPTLLHATCCTVWTPCCTMLHDVAWCCMKFDLVQTFNATSCNISIVLVLNEAYHNMLHPFERLWQQCCTRACALIIGSNGIHGDEVVSARSGIQGGQVCLRLSRTVTFVNHNKDQCRKISDFGGPHTSWLTPFVLVFNHFFELTTF